MTTTLRKPTPQSWSRLLSATEIDVLPLVPNQAGTYFPGWVSYDDTVADSPDVEIFCGGINSKSTIGAALWRQGHLLHFGFDLSPREMNGVGRALLVNSIAYIARFREDRALCRSPSAFAGGVRARSAIAHWLADEEIPLDFVTTSIAPEVLKDVPSERAALVAWFAAHRDGLRPGADGRLVVDEDAAALGLAYDRIEALEQAVALVASDDAERAGHARGLLARFVPEGPVVESAGSTGRAGQDGPAWAEWFAANRPYLFFSEWGGYRWYVDTLARARAVPTAELRGAARADE